MSNDALRILVLADAGSFHTERFVAELRQQGSVVLPASLETGTIDSHQLKRIGFIRQLHYIRSVSEICQLVESFQPDIISAHFASGYGHIGAKVKQRTKIPLSVHLWGSDILIVPHKSFLHKKKVVAALQQADYVFADSEYLIKKALNLYPFTAYSVIPWGVEKKFLALRKKDFIFNNPVKILVPRAQEKVYNNLFIVKALLPMIKADKIELTFPSFGSLYESFQKESSQLSDKGIRFYDKLSRPDYLRFASEHDIYLSASLSDSSPVSLIEAMALGLLPVVGKIEGVLEWMEPHRGYLYDLNSSDSLLKVIADIIDSGDRFEPMRVDNFSKVEQEAVFENNIAIQSKILKKIVEERG